MTKMSLKERYELKTNLTEAIDKEHLKKGVDIIKKMKSINMARLPSFEELRIATVNDISKIISGGNTWDKLIGFAKKGIDPFKKVDKVAAIFSNFFADISEYVNSLHTGGTNRKVGQVVGKDPVAEKNFRRMINKGLKGHSGLLDPKYVLNNVLNLTVDELNQLSNSVSKAFGNNAEPPSDSGQSATGEPQAQPKAEPSKKPEAGSSSQTPKDALRSKVGKTLTKKYLNAEYGANSMEKLIQKLGVDKDGYYKILDALIASDLIK